MKINKFDSVDVGSMPLEDFLEQRTIELAIHDGHVIFRYLEELKKSDIEAFDQILFYFGEIEEYERTSAHPRISWAYSDFYESDKRIHKHVQNAFRLLCPNISLVYDDFEFILKWSHDDMDPIIYNKLIFPDFTPKGIEKVTLNFYV